ncbi:hypothetical protein LTR56_023315 [Elasticomyces elasticus]|nr:hypothetical protein LTR56_023315 [Elasticomyces elasticus]KAK3629846.1 hypothetical protein LTR22_021739 [Elasticomyces elasticus]KAK4908831.1 hypothetical protein LTR49_022335 [Elasticomyces elasticus]KAK5743906.1 hypothetical protein LTS12_023670 [Elasticomyces elasticus]
MSSAPTQETSSETTYSERKLPSPSEISSPTHSTSPEAATEEDDDAVNSSQEEHSSPFEAAGSNNARPKRKRVKRNEPTYRELLNEIIGHAAGQLSKTTDVQLPSQIGASYWSSTEKEALFRALERCDQGDLPELSRAVRTKSKTEIHVYLRLLRDGVLEASRSAQTKNKFSFADVPAAFEVPKTCEAALNNAAADLARKVEKLDARQEEAKHGGGWLINEDLAASIREQLHSAEATGEEPAADGEQSPEEQEESQNASFPSAQLLCPEAFLQLSRNVFMNTPPESGDNWRDLLEEGSGLFGPAIFRMAFDDFHNLAVSFTRRLVQATLFQAQSRLRASGASRTNWTPVAEVKSFDVSTAAEMLNLRTDWWGYWAKVPRRCGLEVYTDIKKYVDGRPGTKNGVKLSYDEVETEMGLRQELHSTEDDSGRPQFMKKEELAEHDFDSDDFTELSDKGSQASSPHSASEVEGGEYSNDSGSGGSIKGEPLPPRKRRRALSPVAFAKLEDEYLETLDVRAGAQETARLWKMLGRDRGEPDLGEPPQPPTMPREQLDDNDLHVDWRTKVKFESLWESNDEAVPASAFAKMEERGRRGREKRMRFAEKFLRRPHESVAESDADTDAATDDGEVEDEADISMHDAGESGEALSEGGVDVEEGEDNSPE